jgi:hypothetical protein
VYDDRSTLLMAACRSMLSWHHAAAIKATQNKHNCTRGPSLAPSRLTKQKLQQAPVKAAACRYYVAKLKLLTP